MDLTSYFNKKMSGEAVNQLLKGSVLIKFMNDDDTHYGMTYVTGLNTDILPFFPDARWPSGGIYVTTLRDFYCHVSSYGNYVRIVSLPDDARVVISHRKMKCNKVILSERMLIKDFISEMIEQKKLTDKSILEAVQHNGRVLKFIEQKFITYEMMLAAVKQDATALYWIEQKFRTHEILLEAVKENGWILDDIEQEFRTEQIMIEALMQEPCAIQFIEHEFRTDAINKTFRRFWYLQDMKIDLGI